MRRLVASLSAATVMLIGGVVAGSPVGGTVGPDSVTGTRIVVEPMGTPTGSLEDLFGQFEEGTEPASEDTAAVTETTEAAPTTT